MVGILLSSPVKELELFPPHLFSPPSAAVETYHFRRAMDADLYSLYSLFYFRRRFLEFRAYFLRQMEQQRQGRSCWLVVESSALIVGNGQFITYPHGAELANLNVTPEFQDRGIGSAMIQILVRLAQHTGQTELEIGVSADNERALKLYQRLGFAEDRVLRDKYAPVIILRKQI